MCHSNVAAALKTWALTKSFKPKTADTPPDDDQVSMPGPDATPENNSASAEPETDLMSRRHRQNRNAEVDFLAGKRFNATQTSSADPDARLYKKSSGIVAVLYFIDDALMENEHGLIVQGDLTRADGHAERRSALYIVHRHSPGSTRHPARCSPHAARLRRRPRRGAPPQAAKRKTVPAQSLLKHPANAAEYGLSLNQWQ